MRKFLIGVVVFIGLFAAFVIGVLWPPKARVDAINRENGDRVVNALLAYEHANHAYPAELKELAPKFIPQIPQVSRGSVDPIPFRYEPSDDKRAFVLRYDEAPLMSMGADAFFIYDSHTREWKNQLY